MKTDRGHLVFFDANAASPSERLVLGSVLVGALPDSVAISPDGHYAVVANEGEPADDFTVDPEGSISVVQLPWKRVEAPKQNKVKTADFSKFEKRGALPAGVLTFGPTPHGADKPISRNLEPECVTIEGDTAYVTLQEANAIAVVHIPSARVAEILPLGVKDYSVATLDPSDRDGTFELRSYPGLYGIYQPDGIQAFRAGDATYLVTANEGDAREWGDYAAVTRVKDLAKNGHGPVSADSPLAAYLGDKHLGRLNVSIEDGFNTATGAYDALYTMGGRSFSIWTAAGEQVFDSGPDFEEITFAAAPQFVNSNHTEANREGRSDDKGPEPESVTIGEVDGRTYAFIGFERVGGIAVYDITVPAESFFVTYVNNRDFSAPATSSAAGDLGPEGLAFIPAEQSPTGRPMVAVASEVSGTTTLFDISRATTAVQVLTVNDFHGRVEQNLANGEGGAAVLAGAVDHFEAENPNTLLVSAGDNIGASTFTSFIADDNPTIDALRESGLDLGAVGNHEFDQGFDDLVNRVTPRFGGAEFSLGANVYRTGTHEPALEEYAIERIDGVRVAFIGTVTPDTASMVTPTGIADIEFGDPLEAANRVAAELTAADAADVIVLLAHDGPSVADQTAALAMQTDIARLVLGASAEIDAIVTGHTHLPLTWQAPVPGIAGKTRPVVQAHQYGTTLGKLDITLDRASKQLLSINASLVPLVVNGVAAFAADPAVKAIVDAATAEAKVLGSVEVGSITGDILRGGTAGSDRGVESPLGNLVADVYLWATSNDDYAGTPAQIGLMNPGGLRADLRSTSGTVTVRDVANVQPFANTLVTVTLTGAQLKRVLEEQWQPAGSSRPKLQLGVSEGFSYVYDAAAPAGSRILSMTLNGATIAATDAFTVVTNSFLAAGGDNFLTFAGGTDRTDTGQIDLAATVAYFEANSPVAPAPLLRAVPVP